MWDEEGHCVSVWTSDDDGVDLREDDFEVAASEAALRLQVLSLTSLLEVSTEVEAPAQRPQVGGVGGQGEQGGGQRGSRPPAVCVWVVDLHGAQTAAGLSPVFSLAADTT